MCAARTAALSALCERERQRRALSRAAHEEHAQALGDLWRNLHRELAGETGAWASDDAAAAGDGSNASAPPPYKWKLDSAEDSSQRRLRLKRDYQYVVYEDDRLARTTSNAANAGEDETGPADGMITKVVGGALKSIVDGTTEEEDSVARAEAEAVAAAAAIAEKEAEREAKELSKDDRRKVLLSAPGTLVSGGGRRRR